MSESRTEEKRVNDDVELLKATRRWVQLWRTGATESVKALIEIGRVFDNASKRYD